MLLQEIKQLLSYNAKTYLKEWDLWATIHNKVMVTHFHSDFPRFMYSKST